MIELNAIDIIYIIFLVGSLAFGLEAMSIGLGGKMLVMYRSSRVKTLVISFLSGLIIIGLSIATSMVFATEPLHFAVLVLIYLFVSGKIIGLFGSKLVKQSPLPPLPKQSDEEIAAIAKKYNPRKKPNKTSD